MRVGEDPVVRNLEMNILKISQNFLVPGKHENFDYRFVKIVCKLISSSLSRIKLITVKFVLSVVEILHRLP